MCRTGGVMAEIAALLIWDGKRETDTGISKERASSMAERHMGRPVKTACKPISWR